MKKFAWWKWLIVALLGLLLWQFVHNSTFIAVKLLQATGGLEALAPWIHTISTMIGLVILLIGMHLLYKWPGGGLGALGLTFENWRRDVVIGLGAGLLNTVLVLFVLIPLVRDNAEVLLEPARVIASSPVLIINGLVLMIIYGGIVEEVFFRGHVITSVRHGLGNKVWSVIIAVALSAFLFAVAHSSYSPLAMGVVAAGGLLYAALYLWTGRLTASMVAHASYDVVTFTGICLLYPVGSVG